MVERERFDDGWTLRAADPDDGRIPDRVRDGLPVSATIPGTVHTDLLAADLIADPYLDDNESKVSWIGNVDWVYERRYHHTPVPQEELTLVFEGLDTMATVAVNGQTVISTANMHRRYEAPIGPDLVPGDNLITVRFDSAIEAAEAEADRLGELPRNYPHPYNFIRKSACNFGWDWGPTLVTAGIWRQVTLVRSNGRRIASASPVATLDGSTGVVEVAVDLSGPGDRAVRVEATVGPVTERVDVASGERDTVLELRIPDALRWWPVGLGKPHLHDVRISLLDVDGAELDRWDGQVGFRTVELDTTPDDAGTPFVFVINGVRVPIRGVNWIPDDCFLPRATPSRVRHRLEQAVEANVNMIRVWGGGVYESNDFYHACDEAGLLVWQDFLFACATYPEQSPHVEEVDAEARDNVTRLRHHPSLVLWNGNNENFEGYEDWGWKEPVGERGWGRSYYLDVLPRAVAETDHTRPYWPGSPYSGSDDVHPNDDGHGPRHIWDAWNEEDYAVYRHYHPRFVAEFGWQAPPTFATITGTVSDDPLTPTSPGLAAHQKADRGQEKLDRGIRAHFPPPTTFDDWLYTAQLVQARAATFGIEHFRSWWPHTGGTVWWQLNDCWPVVSWAAIDGHGRRKPLWYALRAAYRPRLLTFQPRQGALALVAANDTLDPWEAELVVERRSFDGEHRAGLTEHVHVAPMSTAVIAVADDVASPVDPHRELLVATAGDARTAHLLADDLDVRLSPVCFTASVERDGGDVVVSLQSDTVARDVCLFPDRVAPAATVDDQLRLMLPGEVVHFRVGGIPVGAESSLLTWPVLRCENDLVRRSSVDVR